MPTLETVVIDFNIGSFILDTLSFDTAWHLEELGLTPLFLMQSGLLSFADAPMYFLQAMLGERFTPALILEEVRLRRVSSPGFQPEMKTMQGFPENFFASEIAERARLFREYSKLGMYERNLAALTTMVEKLLAHRAKVVLMKFPLHRQLVKNLDPAASETMQRAQEVLIETFAQKIEFWNYELTPQMTDDDFRYIDHLSYRGAEKLTKAVDQRL